MITKILIVNTSSDENLTEYVQRLARKLSAQNVESEIVHYEKVRTLDLSKLKGIILSPTSIDDDNSETKKSESNWVSKLKYVAEIKTYDSPILGICGGHLMLGLLFGSQIIVNKEREVDENSIVSILKKDDPLFENINSQQLRVSQYHNNSITLPPDFEILASSKICQNQIMRHKEKSIYGSQFHLEENDTLFRNFIEIVKKEQNHDS